MRNIRTFIKYDMTNSVNIKQICYFIYVSVAIYSNLNIGATTKQKVPTPWVQHTYALSE